jgi:hypothetical protein
LSYACVGAVEDEDDGDDDEPPGAAAADALVTAVVADAFAAPFGVEPWAKDSYTPLCGRSDMVIVVVVVVVVHARCDVAAPSSAR